MVKVLSICLALVFLVLFLSPAESSRISEVKTYGNFETAGVDIKVDSMDFDEAATVEYKKQSEPSYLRGHDFVRYDGNHMATSLFGLDLATAYDIRITLYDPDSVTGTNPVYTTLTTKPEYVLPPPVRTIQVANQTELDQAAGQAQPGDRIVLAPGTYANGIHISNRSGIEAQPIVFTSRDSTRPVLNGDASAGIELYRANYFAFDNLEVHNENGDGVRIRGCHHIVVKGCYIHDSQPGDYTSNLFIMHSEEGSPPYSGSHLILENVIGDVVHDSVDENQGPGPSNVPVPGQSYFGIRMDYQPGAFTTIRGNTIYGTVDGIHPTGDEGASPVLGPDDPDVLLAWRDQNLDLYDNVIYDCKDDAIECDGHTANGRVFRNRLGKCENAISVAPFYPGPLFLFRNYVHGFHQGCLKQNTGVPGLFRKVLFYHNTVMEKARSSPQHCGSEYCLYRGEPAIQQDFAYTNNIFYGRGRVYNGDNYTSGNYHRNDRFDYDLMYSTRQTDPTYAYKWVCTYGDPLNNTRYTDLPSFRTTVGHEVHGRWGDPLLDTTRLPGYPPNSKLLNLRIQTNSPAIDGGILLPGLNNRYIGAAPDMGAYEWYPVGTEKGEDSGAPQDPSFRVRAYPNPSRGKVAFSYWLSRPGPVVMEVFNVAGQRVRRFELGRQAAGHHELEWDGFGPGPGPGVYFCLWTAGERRVAKKVVIVD